MERPRTSIERVVGKLSEAQRTEALAEAQEHFRDQRFEELEGKERGKTPEELRMIFLANSATNALRRDYGLTNFDWPAANVHVITEEGWPEHEESLGMFEPMRQAIFVREDPSREPFLATLVHEMLHAKSYAALQAVTEDNPFITVYRLGLAVSSRDGKRTRFTNLNEAVTEELTKQLSQKLFHDPLFDAEERETRKTLRTHPDMRSGEGELLYTEDTFHAALGRSETAAPPEKIVTRRFVYAEERALLAALTKKLSERLPEQFGSTDAAFEVFVRAMLTGNILPLGKLIDRAFGAGTLRKIGDLDDDVSAQTAFVESL
jgi:hypothetical protein